jgi:hypothetical protein
LTAVRLTASPGGIDQNSAKFSVFTNYFVSEDKRKRAAKVSICNVNIRVTYSAGDYFDNFFTGFFCYRNCSFFGDKWCSGLD